MKEGSFVSYSDVFSRQHVLLPVIHVVDEGQTLRNVQIARDAGADGVFLIDHRPTSTSENLLRCYTVAKAVHPNFWVGLNFLEQSGRSCATVKRAAALGASGLWLDDVGYTEGRGCSCSVIECFEKMRRDYPNARRMLTFGGAAFKYREPVEDVALAASVVAPFVDVVTTSGDATGQPPTVDKVKKMKKAIPCGYLAVASGITPENVENFMPFVDCFLVSTGISNSFHELDPVRVRQLAILLGTLRS